MEVKAGSEFKATSQAVQAEKQRMMDNTTQPIQQQYASKCDQRDRKFIESNNGAKFLLQIAMARNQSELERIVQSYVPPFQAEQQQRLLAFARANYLGVRGSYQESLAQVGGRECAIAANENNRERAVVALQASREAGAEEARILYHANRHGQENYQWTNKQQEFLLTAAAAAGFAAAVIANAAQEWGVKAPEGMEIGARQAAEAVQAINKYAKCRMLPIALYIPSALNKYGSFI